MCDRTTRARNVVGAIVTPTGRRRVRIQLDSDALQSKQGESDAHYLGSLRINYLRPMKVGDGARYDATPVRIGRGSAVVDSVAIGADGQASAIARVKHVPMIGATDRKHPGCGPRMTLHRL